MSSPLAVRAECVMAAPVPRVWSLIGDLARMPEFSPELRRVFLPGRREGVGAVVVGVNRRGLVAWPTRSRVVRWEPERAVAWRTVESAATWLYEMEPVEGGTLVRSSRVLAAYSLGSRLLTPVLGGAHGHDRELAAGIATTLERIRASVEAG